MLKVWDFLALGYLSFRGQVVANGSFVRAAETLITSDEELLF